MSCSRVSISLGWNVPCRTPWRRSRVVNVAGRRHRRWCEQAGYPYGDPRCWTSVSFVVDRSMTGRAADAPRPARHDWAPLPRPCARPAPVTPRGRRKTALPRRAFPSTDRQTTNSRRTADSKWRTCILWANFENYASRQLLCLTARPLSCILIVAISLPSTHNRPLIS